MSNLSNSKFDFDREDAFDEDVAELDSLSDDDLDIDLEGFDFDDIDLEGMDDWDDDELDEALSDAEKDDSSFDLRTFDADDAAEESGLDDDDATGQTPAQMQQALDEDDELPPLLDDVSDTAAIAPPAAPAASHSRHDFDSEEFEPQEGDHIPVPRINIDVFCETTEISGLIEATANDRRMAKAHINLSFGGVEKAAQHYQNAATPNLIILETVHGGQQLFDGLAHLAEVCDPSTKVVILGKINDVSLYRELMARGISDYLIAPRAPIQITRAIAGLYLDPSAPPIGKNIVFAGTRGGTGSSTICHNVAWAIAENYANDAVLLDLDLPFGTASLDFAQDPSHGLTEALAAPERLDDVLLDRLLQKCTDRLSLFSAPNILDQDYDVPASSFEEVLDIVRKGAPNIVIDLPHGWSGWTRSILHSADQIILTATPDLSSYRNAKNLIETINATRSNDAPPILVMNQVGVPKRPEVPVEQFAEALDIEPTAIIPWDPVLFGTAATNAETVFQTDAKSKVTGSLDFIAGTILGHHGKKSRKKGFDIKSLLKKL